MTLLKKANFFSEVGVSVAGGVTHNVGQILIAMLLLETAEIGYYLVVLTITGTVAGVLIGICGALLVKKVPKRLI
jgi:heptaprenyl diphosphate synthase